MCACVKICVSARVYAVCGMCVRVLFGLLLLVCRVMCMQNERHTRDALASSSLPSHHFFSRSLAGVCMRSDSFLSMSVKESLPKRPGGVSVHVTLELPAQQPV